MDQLQGLFHRLGTNHHSPALHVRGFLDGPFLHQNSPASLEDLFHVHLGVWPAVMPRKLALLRPSIYAPAVPDLHDTDSVTLLLDLVHQRNVRAQW